MMDPVAINNVIQEILVQDGPDGHTDGSDVITEFILALMDGAEAAERWVLAYKGIHAGKLWVLT